MARHCPDISPKTRRAGGALPEHAQQEGGEQRRVHEGKHKLQDVHDVVEGRRRIGRRHGSENADHGLSSAPPPD